MNFIGDHHLNLIHKVAVVTSCSTSTGAAICRELLNCNAFVLGISHDIPHSSTRSSKASHFQFLRCAADDPFMSGQILTAIKGHYHKQNVDYLVNVGEAKMDGMMGVLDDMAARGSGLVLSVAVDEGDGREEEIIKSARLACAQLKSEGIRCIVLVPHTVSGGASQNTTLEEATEADLRQHIKEHDDRRQNGGYGVEQSRDLANMALFLCTAHGEKIKSAIMGIDGSFSVL